MYPRLSRVWEGVAVGNCSPRHRDTLLSNGGWLRSLEELICEIGPWAEYGKLGQQPRGKKTRRHTLLGCPNLEMG